MKNLTYIVMSLCLVALCSCGMTDVWKDWESEGAPNPNRLKPSEIKSVLCAADGWKLNYLGHDFYFQFFEDGTVIANSDNSIEEATSYTTYHFNPQGDKAVELIIDGGGHLAALDQGSEDTYLISGVTDNKIISIGVVNGVTMNLTTVMATEIDAMMEAKSNLLMMLNMKKKGYMNGVIRNADDAFVAHYAISSSDNKIRFISIENRVALHQEANLTINGSTFAFSGITLNGQSITKLTYSNSGEGSAKLEGGSGLKVTSNKEAVSFYTDSSWKTHKIGKNTNMGDAKDELWNELGWTGFKEIEFDDRSPRNMFFCPSFTSADQIYYIGYPTNGQTKSEIDRIYFANTGWVLMFGDGGRENAGVAQLQNNLPKFMAACYDEDGFYLVRETVGNTSYLYFLSPTKDNWFKVQK